MPGNHGGAEASQPSNSVVSPYGPGTQTPGATVPGSSSGTRPGSSSTLTPDSPSRGSAGATVPGGSSGTRPGSSSAVTPDSPSRGDGAGQTLPGSSSARPQTGSSSESGAGYLPGNHGEVTPGSWSGSQGGSSSGNAGTRPDVDRPGEPNTGGATRPGSSSGSGGATRPSTGGSSGSSSGGATRPSTGGSSGSSGGHTRPGGSGSSSSGGHTRPDSNSQGGVRPSGPNSGRPPQSRPSTPGPKNHPYRPHHTRPTTVVHNHYYGPRGPIVHHYHTGHVYWYHGVWVYGPRPVHHVYYNQTTTVQPEARPELPDRKVNRNDAFMLGASGSQMLGSYDGGGSWVDPGIGLSFAYRPVETFSIGLDYSYYNPTMDTSVDTPRETANISPNISVHAVPWKRVSPYAEFGLTASRRIYEDTWTRGGEQMEADVMGTAWGPHAALGLEVAIGKSLALDVSGKYIGYLNVEGDDPSGPSALTASAGLNIYF